jgi:hypothetical protein
MFKHLKLGVEGMAFAATYEAVKMAHDDQVFRCHKNKVEVIHNGEYKFSLVLINKGMNLDSLLLKYGNVDWTNKSNWYCNRRKFPTRKGTYDNGLTVHPLEQVFYKPIWIQAGHPTDDGKLISEAYLRETFTYLKWAVERKKSVQKSSHI